MVRCRDSMRVRSAMIFLSYMSAGNRSFDAYVANHRMETRGFADASSPFLQVGFSKGGQSTPLGFTTIEVRGMHDLRGERS